MKKVYILILLLVFVLGACNTNETQKEYPGNSQAIVPSDTHPPSSGDNSTEGSTEVPKPAVKGVDDVDVLNTHGRVEGFERMKEFYDQMQEGVASDLRIVHYTIEGDPMLTDLKFDGESLEVTYDTTRDKFGSGDIRTSMCGDLVEEMNPTNISYIAVDCTGVKYGMDEILHISYNMDHQDLFQIELQYGEELEKKISTLPKHVLQEVYKKLVLANFLGEKELSASCSSEGSVDYQLKVSINSSERDFRWASCDMSYDGMNFTQVAEYIIEESQKEQIENPPITIQGYVLEVKENEMLIGHDLNRLGYEGLKNEIKRNDLDIFMIDFTYLEGIDTKEFKQGDKILATIEGEIKGSKPGRAKVKDIKVLD